ncbi:MAG TPA: prolyl aminopeptidase, partial [Pelagibacterium sp.]|nr:prolyl aminopeptidase [Pelagibacterium sp.]
LLCPPATSFALAKAWPDANVRIVDTAGHGQGEPGVEAAITQALADLHPTVTNGQ